MFPTKKDVGNERVPLVSFTGRGSYAHRTYSDKTYPCEGTPSPIKPPFLVPTVYPVDRFLRPTKVISVNSSLARIHAPHPLG